MRSLYSLALLASVATSGLAFADEISLVSGFYRSTDNDPGYKTQTIDIGGRWGFGVAGENRHFWFLDLGLSNSSYSGDGAPDGSSGFQIGAGQKWFFTNLSSSIHTYLAWAAGYKQDTVNGIGTKDETSGLYYAGDAGFQFDFSKRIFFTAEAELFNSMLTGNHKVTTTSATGTSTETKTSTTELHASTFSGADSLRFGVGLYF